MNLESFADGMSEMLLKIRKITDRTPRNENDISPTYQFTLMTFVSSVSNFDSINRSFSERIGIR